MTVLSEVGEGLDSIRLLRFELLEQLLLRELKRARRFGYPLALALVALDPLPPGIPPAVRDRLRSQVAGLVVRTLRDVDLPLEVGERFLMLLPHTDQEGAERVVQRLRSAIAAQGTVSGGEFSDEEYAASISVGVAALAPGDPVSFSRLLRGARAALRAAQLKGGGQVVRRR
jgi:diguanylate cyclase (GGDEF)-like protein